MQSAYGAPDVLEVRDVDVPVPGEGEVLVRVRAAGLNIGDWHLAGAFRTSFASRSGCAARASGFPEWIWPARTT